MPRSYRYVNDDGEAVVIQYLSETRDWFKLWSGSEQAVAFAPTDWQRLLDIAPLKDRYYRTSDAKLMAEIRLNEAKLGATPEDRLRLRWRIGGDGEGAAGKARTPSRTKGDPRKGA